MRQIHPIIGDTIVWLTCSITWYGHV